MIRVQLPAHLRIIARVDGEVRVEVAGEPTLASVLDALEARYPELRGTIRDQVTRKRRPFVRFFACEQDLSHEDPAQTLPPEVANEREPLLVVGAVAGGADGKQAVDEYLARVPEPGRTTLEKIREAVRSCAPEGTTEEISYGMPAFRYKKGLIAYAAFKGHCSIFPMSGSVLDELRGDLERYRTSKGTLQFPLDKAPSIALVRKLVKARVAENERPAATASLRAPRSGQAAPSKGRVSRPGR